MTNHQYADAIEVTPGGGGTYDSGVLFPVSGYDSAETAPPGVTLDSYVRGAWWTYVPSADQSDVYVEAIAVDTADENVLPASLTLWSVAAGVWTQLFTGNATGWVEFGTWQVTAGARYYLRLASSNPAVGRYRLVAVNAPAAGSETGADPNQLDPAPITVATTLTAALTDAGNELDPAPLAVTLGITATLGDLHLLLDPEPIAVTVGLTCTAMFDSASLGPVTLATTITAVAVLSDARVMLDPAPIALAITTTAAIGASAGITSVPAPSPYFHNYDPTRLVLRRAVVMTSKLNSFVLGKSKLGAHATVWQNIPAATVTINQSYTPDTATYPTPPPKGPQVCFHTLLIEQETASIALSYWDNPGPLLYAGDRIEVLYAGELLFYGTVDSTSLAYVVDPAAAAHGATRRVDFSATVAGTYAVMMGRMVSWKNLPAESAIKRIRRWVKVNGF